MDIKLITFLSSKFFIEKVAFFAEANISKIHSEYKFSLNEMSDDTDVGDYSKIDKSAKIKFGFNYMF